MVCRSSIGKRVAVAVEGAMTTAGTGPYIAF